MNLYIASTSEYSGKTLIALALGKLWKAAGVKVGYVKLLGKIPVAENGLLVDEDASFIARELSLEGPPESFCPVVITPDLAMAAYRGEELRVRGKITAAVRDAEARSEVLIIGGAANPRDGYFFGVSPLELIANFDCRVVLVDRFEGEKSMDQILWASHVLESRLLGVIFNRVAPEQETFVRGTVTRFLESRGIRVLGALLQDPLLDSVSVASLVQTLSATVLVEGRSAATLIERFCVGSMDVEHALRIFRTLPRKAVITGGLRTDIQLAAIETDTVCLVLTGGGAPHDIILARAREKGVAILQVSEDTFSTVERFERILGRLRIREPEKVARGVEAVRASVDTDGLLALCRKS
ncbi:MAG: phosphotransacetylase family protein [Thermodesulfobacteriota bacterium]